MSAGLRRGLLYGVLALCLMGFCYVQGKSAGVDSVVLKDAAALLGGHRGYARTLDSLARTASQAKAHADSLAKHPRYIQVVTAHHDTVQTIDTVWVAQQITDLNHAYSACSEALTLCKARGDSLEASLAAVLKVKTCKWLFIPCPSRELAFFGGGILGFLIAKH